MEYYTIQYTDPKHGCKLTAGLFEGGAKISLPSLNRDRYTIVPASPDEVKWRISVLNEMPELKIMISVHERKMNLFSN